MSKYLAQVYDVVSDQGPGPILWSHTYECMSDAVTSVVDNVYRLHYIRARVPWFSASYLADGDVVIIQERGKFGSTLATIELVETSRD